jgi:hypothetical protein
VLPGPNLPGLLPTDFGHADELVEQGCAAPAPSCGAPACRHGHCAAPLETTRCLRVRPTHS